MRTRPPPAPRPTLLPVLNPAPQVASPTTPKPATPIDTPSLHLLLQLADSALPTGGFGHSGGTEAAWQLGEIPDRTHLQPFLLACLHQAASASLPIVATAHREPHRLPELDDLCDAWITNHVARRASCLQGRSFWTAVTRAFLQDRPPAPQPGHHAPAFGHLLRQLDIPLVTTADLFLFQHLRSLVSSAVRLGVVGPLEAQTIQFQLGPTASALAARAPSLTLDYLAQTAPLLEILQGAQDRLYSRLFQS